MPFVPHTAADIQAMLEVIGITELHQLFDEIPTDLPLAKLDMLPAGLNEMEMTRLMQQRAQQHRSPGHLLGAGAYEHFVPAAVWQLVSRGEFYTAYTPYQAEASQGSLQLIYEYQTMMAELMAMAVSNASMYDGSTALAEAILMAVRLKDSKTKKVLLPKTINPRYRRVLKTILAQQDCELIELAFDIKTGVTDLTQLEQHKNDTCALVIPQPNFFGCLEPVDEMTAWAAQHHAISIALVNPLAMALLKPPGQWHEKGVDIACGEGQPLGVPLSYGGPYFGFMCTRDELVRQLPGRLVGRTHDEDGNVGYTLTLQAREQHIRRAKAKSNICTNQGLLVVAATIYMSLLGFDGLREVAIKSHQNTQKLLDLFEAKGAKRIFSAPYFHEVALTFNRPLQTQLGYDLQLDYAELVNTHLVCVTETKTEQDLARYADALI